MPLFPQADRELAGIFSRLGVIPRHWLAIACTLGVTGIALLDRANGPYISLAIFYILPVTVATWYLGRIWGLLLATISGCLWAHDVSGLLPLDMPIRERALSAAVHPAFFVVIMWLVAGMKETLEHARLRANTDEMTGVYNRRAFMAAAHNELVRMRRSGLPLSVVYLDCDHLKRLNDTLGHSVGDQALRAVAATLVHSTRATDIIARLGGDEFTLLLPATDQPSAQIVVAKLREGVGAAMKQRHWPITLSIGVVTFHQPPENADELLKQADALQYVVKHGGKDGVLYKAVGGLVTAA